VVNDGSTDRTCDTLRDIQGITILNHDVNRGKGAAIVTGCREAVKVADWAITVDADGQHDPFEARRLMDTVSNETRPIIVGRREGMTGRDVPWTSRFGRRFSNFWVFLSGGPLLGDSQSGFRIYPLPESLKLGVISMRYQFEVEILVKAGWRKIPVKEVPISVNYWPEMKRVSHFRPFVDFLRNSAVFARLIVQRAFVPHSKRSRP
ncbi:MAG: glycosyltransferase family 2 protein, partial [Proteobacteria bacterium]|nr:glycosyltransferase family 2 protein [Pseudomonadota bacterium]